MTITVVPDSALIDTLHELTAAYGLASRLLLAPADEELLAELTSPGPLDVWPACHCEESLRGLAYLRRSLHEGESAEVLAADFVRLFADPARVIPPPYESVYRPTEQGHVEGDHLSLELARAGRLCGEARACAERGDAAEASRCLAAHRDYLAEHLLRWAPRCLREIEAAAATHFYRGAAELALSVLTCAHERLG